MFKSSITIGKIFDIPIRIHVSFLIILPFLAWAFGNNIKYITENSDINYSELVLNPHFLGLLLAIGLFTSVLLHELSHSLVAKSKGIPINSITLMLFGGVSSMEELTENPDDEARMAMAGPLLSIVLGIILILIYNYLSAAFIEDVKLLVLYLGQLHIFLAIFNLLPAFPSDGGRILRALLASRTSFLQATKIAVSVGKVFAFGFGLLGLISGNFMLIFIGFFLYIGASQEYQYNHIKSALAEMKVTDLMSRDVDTITEDMSVEKLIDKMYDKKH
ncbi:MAG: site-2 protease family protein [Halanaerobiaceae bacterium]